MKENRFIFTIKAPGELVKTRTVSADMEVELKRRREVKQRLEHLKNAQEDKSFELGVLV